MELQLNAATKRTTLISIDEHQATPNPPSSYSHNDPDNNNNDEIETDAANPHSIKLILSALTL